MEKYGCCLNVLRQKDRNSPCLTVFIIYLPVSTCGQFCGPYSTVRLASHAAVLRGSSRVPAPARDEPLRTVAWEATVRPAKFPLTS